MTAQIPERLILDGLESSMAFCPPLPVGHPRLVQAEPGAQPAPGDSAVLHSTACWRQYQGTWEIKDGRLFLVSLRGLYHLDGPEPLPADWFTGVLRIPRGEMLHYVHMGFGSVFEQELHIKIEQGRVTNSRTVDNRGLTHDPRGLGFQNLPGGENRFPGDDQL
jgi:hypothetical protein